MKEKIGTGKVIGGIVLILVIMIASNIAATVVAAALAMVPLTLDIGVAAEGVIYVACVYFLGKLLITRFLKGSLEAYNIPRFRIDWKWLLTAFLLPLAVTGIYLCLPGEFVKGDMTLWDRINTVIMAVFVYGLSAGAVEEFVFRGVILNLLDQRFGRKAAIIVPSVLFGILHLSSDLSILSAVLVLIAGTTVGIMFSLISLEGSSIWNSAAVHAVWNIVIIGGIFVIGESADSGNICAYVLSTKHFAITGGEFGVESSAIAVLGYLIVCCTAYAGMRRKNKMVCD